MEELIAEIDTLAVAWQEAWIPRIAAGDDVINDLCAAFAVVARLLRNPVVARCLAPPGFPADVLLGPGIDWRAIEATARALSNEDALEHSIDLLKIVTAFPPMTIMECTDGTYAKCQFRYDFPEYPGMNTSDILAGIKQGTLGVPRKATVTYYHLHINHNLFGRPSGLAILPYVLFHEMCHIKLRRGGLLDRIEAIVSPRSLALCDVLPDQNGVVRGESGDFFEFLLFGGRLAIDFDPEDNTATPYLHTPGGAYHAISLDFFKSLEQATSSHSFVPPKNPGDEKHCINCLMKHCDGGWRAPRRTKDLPTGTGPDDLLTRCGTRSDFPLYELFRLSTKN